MLPNSRDKGIYKPFQVISDIPFKFRMNGPDAPSAHFTLKDFLDDLKKSDPTRAKNLQYRYAWWREPPAVWSLWGGGSVLLIGVIWPAVLSLLVSPEVKRAAVQAREEKRAQRRPGKPEPTAAKGKRVTQADMDSLDAVTARFGGRPARLRPRAHRRRRQRADGTFRRHDQETRRRARSSRSPTRPPMKARKSTAASFTRWRSQTKLNAADARYRRVGSTLTALRMVSAM